jgi:acetyl esterase/lipase
MELAQPANWKRILGALRENKTARILPRWAAALLVAGSFGCTKGTAQDSPPADNTVEIIVEKDIEYGRGGDVPLKLDLARPTTEGPHPGIICIHGGGWRGGSKDSLKAVTTRLAKEGFVAATVQYRFAPKFPFPAQVEDVKCAVRWLRAHAKELGLNPDRIGAIGFSAGGHLSLMLGVMDAKDGLEGQGGHADQSSKVQAVVNFFGPADLRRNYPQIVHGLLQDFVGGPIEEKGDVIQAASPITYLDDEDAPILTFHGTADPIVPYEQAKVLDQACKDKKIAHRLVTIERGGHGWGGEQLLDSLEQSLEFFRAELKAADSE